MTVSPTAEAGRLFERLGWRHVVSTKLGSSSGMDVMLLTLETHAST